MANRRISARQRVEAIAQQQMEAARNTAKPQGFFDGLATYGVGRGFDIGLSQQLAGNAALQAQQLEIAEAQRAADVQRQTAAGTMQARNALMGMGTGPIGSTGMQSLAQNIYQQVQGGVDPTGAAQSALGASQPGQMAYRNQQMMAALQQQQQIAAMNQPQFSLKPTELIEIQAQVTGLSQGIEAFQTLDGLLQAYPSSLELLASPEAVGTARAAMPAAAAAMNQMLDLGALTSDEREFLFEMQANPDSAVGRLFSRDATTRATYNGLIRRMEIKRASIQGVLSRLPGADASVIDFGNLTSPFTTLPEMGDIVGTGTKPPPAASIPEAIIPPGTALF